MKALQKPHLVRHLLRAPTRQSKRKGSLKSEKTVRQLLGELYVDKEYLEKLLLDEGFRHCLQQDTRQRERGVDFMHEAEPVL